MRVAISNPVITKSFVACQLEDNSFVAGEEPPEMWLAVAVSHCSNVCLFTFASLPLAANYGWSLRCITITLFETGDAELLRVSFQTHLHVCLPASS